MTGGCSHGEECSGWRRPGAAVAVRAHISESLRGRGDNQTRMLDRVGDLCGRFNCGRPAVRQRQHQPPVPAGLPASSSLLLLIHSATAQSISTWPKAVKQVFKAHPTGGLEAASAHRSCTAARVARLVMEIRSRAPPSFFHAQLLFTDTGGPSERPAAAGRPPSQSLSSPQRGLLLSRAAPALNRF